MIWLPLELPMGTIEPNAPREIQRACSAWVRRLVCPPTGGHITAG